MNLLNDLYKHFEYKQETKSKTMKVYIRFRNCKKGFQIDKVEFENYDDALAFANSNENSMFLFTADFNSLYSLCVSYDPDKDIYETMKVIVPKTMF